MKHKWFTLVSAVSLIVVGLWALPSRAAQTSVLWYDVRAQNIAASGTRDIIPDRYRMLRLNELALRQLLTTAPLEGTSAAHSTAPIIDLPLPDGGFGRFRFVESPIMVPELAAKFPKIKTYAGQGLDDETATVRFDVTPAGFHAQILSAHGAMYIDPYSRGTTAYYISYAKRDFKPAASKGFSELPPPPDDRAMAAEIASLVTHNPNTAVGPQLRTYRLAVAATGEYTLYQGGSAAQGLAAIVTSVNRVDGIYETEVAVRMVLVANNNLIVYTNSDTDPYTNGDPYSLLSENQANLDAVIGNANYDVGHVFSTAGGGLAQLGVPCAAGFKAQGETGTSAPVGDPFDVDYVAHEMGHQFGGNHTFNGNAGSCGGGNRNGPTAYEPGSGSTIMAYAGICGAQDLQPHSDAFFHTISFDEIVAYTTVGSGNSCAAITTTGNAAPLPNAGAGYTIPRQTPFTLTGSATDPNGDPVTYNWEEFDLGSAGAPNNPLNPPFFRSFNSTVSPARTFPKWSDIVNNTTTIGEILPNVTRAMVFRLTVRDNRSGGGGVDRVATTINVTTAAGPFQVTVPNTAVTWAGNSSQNVTWNAANTTASPINCATVNIRLSTDGGYTYPVSLASGVSNNGSASISVPNISTTTARVQVACASNIFFDISNVNFTIVPSVADVMLGQTITPTLVRPNSLITYTLTITNASASSSSIITVTDNLPTTGFNLGSASGTGWTCAPLSQVVTCTLPALSANGVTTINLTGTVTAATGTLTNTAWVTSTSDQVPGNNGPITLVTAITPLLDQTITFNPLPDRTYGDPDFVITATASSGLPVSFVAGAPDRCTNIGSTIHLTGAGTCTVTATQAGEGIYGPASPVSRTFQISQALSSVSLTSAPNPAMVLRPITFTATVTSTAGTPTGAVQLYADGALFGYPIALSSGSATWVTHTLTVGTHIITATYSGAGNYTSSTSTLAGGQVVEPIRLYLPVIWR